MASAATVSKRNQWWGYSLVLVFVASSLVGFAFCNGTKKKTENSLLAHKKDKFLVELPPIPHVLKHTQRAEEARKKVIKTMQAGRFRGYYSSISAGAVIGQRLVFEHHISSSPQKHYGLASITKTYTALAAMLLIKENKIHLEDKVTKFLPRVQLANPATQSGPVRIRHLLSHTSGLPDLRTMKCSQWHRPKETGLPFIVPYQVYPAGASYRYSNQGFMILGEIIKKVSGKSIPQLYNESIFEPLNMPTAHFRARRYSGAFGLRNSMEDLKQYGKFWANGGLIHVKKDLRRLLPPRLYQAMFRPPVTYPERGGLLYTGLGWRIKTDEDGVMTFFHIGGARGTMGWVQIFPRYRAAIFYLGNPPRITGKVLYHELKLQRKLGDLVAAYTNTERNIYKFHKNTPGPEIKKQMVGRYRPYLPSKEGNHRVVQVRLRQGQVQVEFRPGRFESLRFRSPRTALGILSGKKYDFDFVDSDKPPVGFTNHRNYFAAVPRRKKESPSSSEKNEEKNEEKKEEKK